MKLIIPESGKVNFNTPKAERTLMKNRDVFIHAKCSSQSLANVYNYFRERSTEIGSTKGDLIGSAIELLDDILTVSGKIERRVTIGEAHEILTKAFPKLDIRKSMERAEIRNEIDEEREALQEALQHLEGGKTNG